jgi:hypothetical protein
VLATGTGASNNLPYIAELVGEEGGVTPDIHLLFPVSGQFRRICDVVHGFLLCRGDKEKAWQNYCKRIGADLEAHTVYM